MNYERYKTSALKILAISLLVTVIVILLVSCMDMNNESSSAAYESKENLKR